MSEMRIQIDRKYSVAGSQVVNSASGRPLNIGEPRILFRGSDVLVVAMLYHYIDLAKEAKADVHFIEQMREIAEDFEAYRALAPQAMKVPN